MKALNKETAPKVQRPERIIQFGEVKMISMNCSSQILKIINQGFSSYPLPQY